MDRQMRANEILNEKASRGRPIVAVDLQPAYSGMMDGAEDEVFEAAIRFVNDSRAPCLMFVNAEQEGLTSDTINDVKIYWEDSGFDPRNWGRIEVYDKGYGYLRGWMDQNVSDRAIIKTIREMYVQKVNDSRELFQEAEDYSYAMEQFLGGDWDEAMEDDNISVGWVAVDQLKRYNNCYLVGGGRNECLKEVALLMNAFNIKYKMIEDFVYG